MKPFFRSVLVLIPRACSGPDEAPMQEGSGLRAAFQPDFMPYRRGMETAVGQLRKGKDRRGMAGLGKMCTCKTEIKTYKSCILSILIGWCSVLYRVQK